MLAFILINECTIIQNIQAPIMRVVRRGSCIAIDIPPITLTPARTAAEKQLIGEEVVLEKDGWLIASAQSSAMSDSSHSRKSGYKKLKNYYIELGTIDFYSTSINSYKKSGLIGESFNGKLQIVPLKRLTVKQKSDFVEERKVAKQVILEVNASRKWIWEYKSRGQSNAAQIQLIQKKNYFDQAKPGEWIFDKSGVWKKNQ